jgi:hypothetical protein
LWCASLQLKSLTGSDDTTLVYFLMSLTSPEEVREYIAEYLGAGPKSSLFADEFIKRRCARGAHASVRARAHASVRATASVFVFVPVGLRARPCARVRAPNADACCAVSLCSSIHCPPHLACNVP